MKRKITAILLIVMGIVVLLFPKLSEMYYDHQQEQLLKEWQVSLQNIDNGEEPTGQEQEKKETGKPASTRSAVKVSNKKEPSKPKTDENTDGVLTIEKINLKLPILQGATKENMRTTVASITNTGQPGEVGNYAIAGHRNRTYGRNFNRLDELELGDRIGVNDGRESYDYEVTEKLYVKPEEVWVLKPNGSDKEITLVTCHPLVNPTHRLIVKGKMVEPTTRL
ncbi:class D sortase [Paenibacillus sp. DMB20]|uniref:class D sortase n=1 Tax=Paenibacillus sp. DMB20 TaxID=1642570 RepID=UPI0006280F5A|nr:class D sortase [Paenibacillus sp. DMB20]KKO51066.1 sortase [Paenibacillus sp. DMB20]